VAAKKNGGIRTAWIVDVLPVKALKICGNVIDALRIWRQAGISAC